MNDASDPGLPSPVSSFEADYGNINDFDDEATTTLLAAHGGTARLRFFGWFRRLVDPPVRVLIRDGAVNRPNLKRAGITRSDVDAILRQHGYQDATDVELALYEAKGSVSVFARRSRTGDRAGPAQPEPGSLR